MHGKPQRLCFVFDPICAHNYSEQRLFTTRVVVHFCAFTGVQAFVLCGDNCCFGLFRRTQNPIIIIIKRFQETSKARMLFCLS